MTTAPAVMVTGSLGASAVAASITHEIGVTWLAFILTGATGAGLAWLRWSAKKAIQEQVDVRVEKRLHELGLLEDPPEPRAKRRRP